jgi:tRNA pseudouridine32 synthase/23S rRNA pseudouridine746 synthase
MPGLDLALRVLYRDGLMLVLNKPAGIPVHAGPGGGPNIEMFVNALRFGLPKAPALAHRLDRDTSGCLIFGRHHKALVRLNRLFAEGRIDKRYWALVAGEPPDTEGIIDAPLIKQVKGQTWRMRVDEAGRLARSAYRVVAARGGVSLIEMRPYTGRTHQVRVHLASIGCPVMGDPVYGESAAGRARLFLHARAVSVPLYPERPPIDVIAPLPRAFEVALRQFDLIDALNRCA